MVHSTDCGCLASVSSTYTTLADQYYRSLSSDAAFNVSHKYSTVGNNNNNNK